MQFVEFANDFGRRTQLRRDALAQEFDTAYEIRDAAALEKAQELMRQIGTVDWETERYRTPEFQRDLSIKFHWGHDHRFSENLFVAGRMKDRHLWLIAEFLEAFGLSEDHFRGKDVLDIGCWTGGTSLTLKMLGAGNVVALEEVQKYASTAERLCRDVYGLSDVRCEAKSLYHLDSGDFDSVYFPGVVYHLSDPVLGLRRLFNRLRDGGDILVESMGIESDQPLCRFMSNAPNETDDPQSQSRSGWNWFVPSATCLGAWLETAGFEDVRVFLSPIKSSGTRVFGYGRRRAFKEITRAGLSVPDII